MTPPPTPPAWPQPQPRAGVTQRREERLRTPGSSRNGGASPGQSCPSTNNTLTGQEEVMQRQTPRGNKTRPSFPQWTVANLPAEGVPTKSLLEEDGA